jgi:hypothetical protein
VALPCGCAIMVVACSGSPLPRLAGEGPGEGVYTASDCKETYSTDDLCLYRCNAGHAAVELFRASLRTFVHQASSSSNALSDWFCP